MIFDLPITKDQFKGPVALPVPGSEEGSGERYTPAQNPSDSTNGAALMDRECANFSDAGLDSALNKYDRRIRNGTAAKKLRGKRKAKEEDLEADHMAADSTNLYLKNKVLCLEKEIREIRMLLTIDN